MSSKTIYLPGLNGLRAIAAIAVVISHTTLSLNKFNLDPNIFGSLQNGEPQGLLLAGNGVSIFFVLSGFLITYLLQ
ncbi:MAG TPA: acyltransferase family protein, partial [Bacteroidia bacterium]|nr:acyltransferase family protein [Bacteroidia bacterium]